MNSLATRGNKMELLLSNNDYMVLKEIETNKATNDQQLTETELCKTYGYELAMSPAETNMPDDGDQSWMSDDDLESHSPSLKMATEDFDLLEPFLIDSGRTCKRPGKVSELYWFSDDSSDSQTSVVKMCTEEFDQLETAIFNSKEPSMPFIDLMEHLDEGKSNDSANSPAGQQSSSEKYIAETTILVKALVKRMTLGQRMKFYGWFNSGSSIEEAALKSKIPDLIPPPVRHPDCKLSKKRLRRLSKILPNVFMQRQFVNETYFVGVDPKQCMRYLLMDLGYENLIATFECQFALEEYAAAKDKQLRHDKREKAASDALATAPASVKQLWNPDLETGIKGFNSEVIQRRTNDLKLKYQATEEELPRGNVRDRTTSDDNSPIFELSTTENLLRKDTRVGTAAADNLAIVKLPPNSDFEVGTGEPNSKTNPRKTNGFILKGDELKKFYFWCKQGLSVHEAASIAKMNGLDRDIRPHPDCKHSWEKLHLLAKALPNGNSRELFLVKVYYEGMDPGEVLKDILSGENDSPESSQVAESESGAESHTLSDNVTDGTSFVVENVLLTKSYSGTKAIGTSADTEFPTGKSIADIQMSKPSSSRVKQNSGGEGMHKAEILVNKKKHNGLKYSDPKHESDPILEPQSNGGNSETPLMSLKQLKEYYKWRNQGSSHSEALVNAQTPGLIPESIPHPGCKYSLKEVKDMSDAISKKHKRSMFQIEVFYGGKKPEDVMKKILSSYQEDTPLKSHPTADSFDREMSDRSIGDAGVDRQVKPYPSRPEQAKFDHTCSFNDRSLDEDTTELSEFSCKQLENYYRWRNSGLSFSEALSKARISEWSPMTDRPHPDCKHSLEEIRAMASTLHTRSSWYRFYVEVYYGGKDPNEMLKHMKTGVPQASEPDRPDVPNASHHKLPRFLQNELSTGNRGASVQNGMETVNSASREMSSVRQAFRNTISEEYDDSMFNDPVLELSNRWLKKYYAWRNKGLSHDSALLKALFGKNDNLSGRELNELYVAHRNCNYSIDELKRMSLKLPEGWARERFIIHTFFGGMVPCHAMNLLKRTPLPDGGLNLSKCQIDLMKRVQIKYLMGKGLNRNDALQIMRNPSENQIEELKEVMQIYVIKRKAYTNGSNLAEVAESTKIPLSSPYHPSKLLSDDQLKKYYLWISKGCSPGDAFGKVMNCEPIPRDMHESHYIRSKYKLEEVKKMSKNLMHEALARKFIIEVFYGQTDPDEAMEFMSRSAKSVKPHQDVCRDLAKNPWLPSKKVQVPLHSIEADRPTKSYSGYPKPADVCSPIEQQYINDTVDHSDRPDQTPSSSKGPLNVQNPALRNNQVQCFIVPVDFPNAILTEPQMDSIENSVLEAILEMDDDDTKPSFKDSLRSSGRYGIICNDEFSVDWLYKYLRVYEPWEGALLRMITSQSAKRRANAVLPLCEGDDDEKILKFIGKQNFGLNVGKWTVSLRWDSNDGTYMDLVIDEESAEILLRNSRISFKLGSAEIITAQKDRSYHVTDSSKNQPASPPPLPSSPPPASPPPPPPPSPQPLLKPSVIDTSLGALLKRSASQSHQDRSQKVHSNSARTDGTSRYSSPEESRGKRLSRRDQSLRERKRSRSSSLDPCGRILRNSSPRTRKRRRYEKERERSASGSSSRDHGKKRRRRRKRDRYGSMSPSTERPRSKGGNEQTWFYPGGKKLLTERFSRNTKRAPRRSMTPYSSISSEDNLSFLGNPHGSSLPTCPPGVDSLENTEYAQYLGNFIPKPSSDDIVDLTGST